VAFLDGIKKTPRFFPYLFIKTRQTLFFKILLNLIILPKDLNHLNFNKEIYFSFLNFTLQNIISF